MSTKETIGQKGKDFKNMWHSKREILTRNLCCAELLGRRRRFSAGRRRLEHQFLEGGKALSWKK